MINYRNLHLCGGWSFPGVGRSLQWNYTPDGANRLPGEPAEVIEVFRNVSKYIRSYSALEIESERI